MPDPLPGQLVLENFSTWYSYDYDLLEKLLCHHQCLFIEKDPGMIKTRLFEKFSTCLIFDKQMAERLLNSRIIFSCDTTKHIGILVRKEQCYRCQIQSAS